MSPVSNVWPPKKVFSKAWSKGKLEGKTEKAATILERLLVKRFDPLDEETRKRLGTATLEQLDLWADRILDATTIDAMFEGH